MVWLARGSGRVSGQSSAPGRFLLAGGWQSRGGGDSVVTTVQLLASRPDLPRGPREPGVTLENPLAGSVSSH